MAFSFLPSQLVGAWFSRSVQSLSLGSLVGSIGAGLYLGTKEVVQYGREQAIGALAQHAEGFRDDYVEWMQDAVQMVIAIDGFFPVPEFLGLISAALGAVVVIRVARWLLSLIPTLNTG